MANMTFKASLLPSADNTYSLGSNESGNEKRWKIYGNLYGNADTATTAVNLSNKPSLPINGDTIAVTAGGKTSDYITVPYSTTALYIKVPDTRSTTILPSDLKASQGIRFDFKAKSITGLSATYSGVMSFRPYADSTTDWSGGPAHQLAFDNDGLHWRKSTDGNTWNDWQDLVRNSGTWNISISGTAAKATADSDGNNIKNTYATKASIEALDVSSPDSSGSTLQFIDTVSQINGKISATKKQVQNATSEQAGVVSTDTQTFSGDKTFNGLITTSHSATHKGIKVGDTYINASNGDLILQNNNAIRFGTDTWDYKEWAGLKYVHSTKTISLGLADGTTFTTSSGNEQANGILNFPGIDKVVLTQNSGGLYKYYSSASTAPFLQVNSNNVDVSILKIDGNSPIDIRDSQSYGFNLKYIGTGDGANNTLRIYGDNSDGVDALATEWSGDGKVGISGTYNTDYNLYVHGTSYHNGNDTHAGNINPEATNTRSLGETGKRWSHLYIGTKDTYGSNVRPIWWNGGVPTEISYTANRLYYPSTAETFTAGTHFVSDTKIAINSTSNPSETLYVNGNTKINGTLHITPPSGSYVEGIRIYPSSAGWTSIALCGTDNTGNSGTSAATWSLHTKDSNFYLSQNGSSSATVRFTGHNGNGFSIRPRLSINADVNTGYNLYVNGTSYLNGSLYMPATSGIYTIGNQATYMMIRFMDNTADTYGNGISIGGGGPTIIGGGESANTMADHNGNNGNEIMYIGNDENIDFYTNLQNGWDSGKHIYMDTNGDFRGSRYIYANYYNASCGAETPSNASYWIYSNSDGFFRKSTLGNLFNLLRDNGGDGRWVKKAGDTMTGILTLPAIELKSATPYIDFHYGSSTADYTNRIIEDASGQLKITGKLKVGTTRNGYALNAASFICDSWVRTVGSTGWYNESYGGGWYMVDSTYIRNYGSKQVYLNAQLGVDATLRMWSASRQITRDASGRSWVDGRNGAILRMTGTAGTNYNPITSCKSNNGSWEMGTYTANNGLYFTYITDSNFNAGTNSVSAQVEFRGSDNSVRASKVYGAVWNDYAEMRNVPEAQNELSKIKPGMCVQEVGDDTMIMTTERLQRGCKVISDTFGFNIGETENCKTPIAVSGRVLVYLYEGREEAKSHIGWPVCSGPNGTVSIMTEEEEEKYPSRIVGTISAVPDYEEWGLEKVKVNGRIWIYVK